jgi:hypothetical protein
MCVYPFETWKKEGVRKDSRRVGTKRKSWGRRERHFIPGGEGAST